MANPEHLEILKKGVKEWHFWKDEHSDEVPDLRGADLSGMDLSRARLGKADLSDADLKGADLSYSGLRETNLTGADLRRADLSRAKLVRANLTGGRLRRANLRGALLEGSHLNCADLSAADLTGADLINADVRAAILIGANFHAARLTSADFSAAVLLQTVFRDVDLSLAKGLAQVDHRGPSSIDLHTIYRSQGQIPESFLRGVGVPEEFLTFMKSRTGDTVAFYSCFISYSTRDQGFAGRLYEDLQHGGVRCWFAPEDLKTGDELRPTFDEAIRVRDKLLLVLSEHSVRSPWVQREVKRALDEENRRQLEGRKDWTVLFPIRLDDAVFPLDGGWVTDVKQRYIGDFTRWKDHDSYQKAFERLLRDLKDESKAKDKDAGR